MRFGGIVLCGGESSRMGRPKAWLPFGAEFMLQRVVRVLRDAVEPVVVVAAPNQDVPPLPREVEIVRDEVEGNGPLGGLAAGLAALAGRCDAVYLSSCDVPLLRAEFVRRVCEEPLPPTSLPESARPTPPTPLPEGKGESDTRASLALNDAPNSFSPFPSGRGVGGVGSSLCAAPRVNGFLHPLAAAYRVEVLPVVRAMLAANRLRMTDLFDLVTTRLLDAEELTDADPELASLRNLNTPEEYEAALRELDAPRPG